MNSHDSVSEWQGESLPGSVMDIWVDGASRCISFFHVACQDSSVRSRSLRFVTSTLQSQVTLRWARANFSAGFLGLFQ